MDPSEKRIWRMNRYREGLWRDDDDDDGGEVQRMERRNTFRSVRSTIMGPNWLLLPPSEDGCDAMDGRWLRATVRIVKSFCSGYDLRPRPALFKWS